MAKELNYTEIFEDYMNRTPKHGSITEMILQHVKVNGPCSYTELNKLYQCGIHGRPAYDAVADRGGSFSHHRNSLVQPLRRNYSGKIEYLVKADGHQGKYHYGDNTSYITSDKYHAHYKNYIDENAFLRDKQIKS